MDAVRIYTTRTCGYCHAALALLRAKSIAFEQIDVSGNPKLRSELVARTGRSTVPQVFVGERSLGGFTDLLALERRGELDTVLNRALG